MSSSKRKKERRRLRYERNVRKEQEHKASAWAGGKLIEENHNNKEYSVEYTRALAERLVELLRKGTWGAQGDNERFIVWYRMYRMKIRDLLLLWNDNEPKKPEVYYVLKSSIEFYWDERDNLLPKLLNLILTYYPTYIPQLKTPSND